MMLKVSLVVVILALNYILISAYEADKKKTLKENKIKKIFINRLTNSSTGLSFPKIMKKNNINNLKKKNEKSNIKDISKFSFINKNLLEGNRLPKDNTTLPELRDHHKHNHPKKQKHKFNRMLMALLLAYKLKFVALIPTMVGGLILLVSATALAGFFFALFAAILGLKGH